MKLSKERKYLSFSQLSTKSKKNHSESSSTLEYFKSQQQSIVENGQGHSPAPQISDNTNREYILSTKISKSAISWRIYRPSSMPQGACMSFL
jgi:hypothetical protein